MWADCSLSHPAQEIRGQMMKLLGTRFKTKKGGDASCDKQ